MPPKDDPRDWDRLFRRGAAGRGGPLRALGTVLIALLLLGLLGGTSALVLSQVEGARTIASQTQVALQTREARERAQQTEVAATAAAAPTATPAATAEPPAEPTALALIGRATVANGGNLRSAPDVRPETVIGQVCAGDRVELLEVQTVGGGEWYRLRVVESAGACVAGRVSVGSLGWLSASLLGPRE